MTLPWPSRPSPRAVSSSRASGTDSNSASSWSASCSMSRMVSIMLARTSEPAHERGAFVEHRQDLVARLRRQRQHDAVDPGVAVALEQLRIARSCKNGERERGGIAPRLLGHLAELGQHFERIDLAA